MFRNRGGLTALLSAGIYFILAVPELFALNFVVNQVTDNNFDDIAPLVSNKNIVWNSGENVFIRKGTDTFCIGSGWDVQIDKDCVAWENNYNIYYYNGIQTIQLTNDGLANVCPRISNKQVAWSKQGQVIEDPETGMTMLNAHIMFFDGVNSIFEFTSGYDKGVDIVGGFHNGQIAWQREVMYPFFTSPPGGLYLGPFISNVFAGTIPLSWYYYSMDFGPDIHNGQVVWVHVGSSSSEILLFDGFTKKRISTDSYSNCYPRINNKKAAWLGYDGHDYEVYMFDGTRTLKLTNNNYDDGAPSISNGKVAWAGFDGRSYQVSVYDGSEVTQITHTAYNNVDPAIDANRLVWQGFDGNDYEIYYADIKDGPLPITDLAMKTWTDSGRTLTANSITLTWTAPGESTGYNMYYSTSAIAEESLSAARMIEISTSVPAGQKQEFRINALGQGTKYYFAAKSKDDDNNLSDLSNIVEATTMLNVPDIKQFDPEWGEKYYLKTSNEIQKEGCALTSMAMIVNYYADYHPEAQMRAKIVRRNPKELNDLLVANSWYYRLADIDFHDVVRISSGAVMMTKEFEISNDGTVNSYMHNRMPILFKVDNPHTNSQTGSIYYTKHFVVATGSCPAVGYTINDPGYSLSYSLNKRYSGKYTDLIRFKPSDGNDNYSAISIKAYPGEEK